MDIEKMVNDNIDRTIYREEIARKLMDNSKAAGEDMCCLSVVELGATLSDWQVKAFEELTAESNTPVTFEMMNERAKDNVPF